MTVDRSLPVQDEVLTQEEKLAQIRQEIDVIDRQIHALLNQRARCAQSVAEVKDVIFYCPEREAQVLRKVMERNEGPLADSEVARLFREVMSVCLALEQPMKVVFLGPEASFAQQAAYKHFGHSVKAQALDSLEQVFKDVQAGKADYGLVPIENVSEAMIDQVLDLFSRFKLNICGEVELTRQQAITSKMEDQPESRERYLVIGNQYVTRSGQDKTSILILAHNQPNTSVNLFDIFKRRNLSVTLLESRSAKNSDRNSIFYIDFEGHSEDEEIRALMSELENQRVEYKSLGSYPKAVL